MGQTRATATAGYAQSLEEHRAPPLLDLTARMGVRPHRKETMVR